MTFAVAVGKVLGHEGAYSNNPLDSGGETNWGITVRVAIAYGYKGPMRDMPRHEAVRIYKEKFWDSQKLDLIDVISPEIAYEIFDTGVNQGETVGASYFQRALNVLNMNGKFFADIPVDGRIGMITVSCFKEYMSKRPRGATVMLRALNCLQGSFYIELAERREKDEAFIYGWLDNRVIV